MSKAPVVGILGAGPSVRMLYPAAIALGVHLRILARTSGESAASIVPDVVFGSDDQEEVFARFADGVGLIIRIDEHQLVDGVVILLARSPHGQVSIYPATLIEGLQARTPVSLEEDVLNELHLVALAIAVKQDVIGILAVTFDADSREVLDVALGPHPAGLWTIDGALTNQFEQHLRGVLDLPLGSPHARSMYIVSEVVLGGDKPDLFHPYLHLFARDPSLRVHLYGVPVEHDRPIGHVTVMGDDLDSLRERAEHAAGYLNGRIDE